MTDEISKMLTLSTGHITKATSELLELVTDDVPVNFSKGSYGWIMVVPSAPYGASGNTHDPPTCPDDLKAVLAYARGLGCEWLCLDCDGDINLNLPTWEW
jgi:hypothetical protein